MAEVRGILVSGMKAYMTQIYGAPALEEAMATLPPDEVALLQKKCLDASFYPYEMMIALRHLMRAAAAANPKGAATLAENTGAFLADYVFRGVYKAFLPKDAPAMVGKVGWVKDYFYRDLEKVDASMTGGASARLTYHYEPGHRQGRSACKSLGAFWARALELAGGKKVSATHPVCISDGADHCEFTFSW